MADETEEKEEGRIESYLGTVTSISISNAVSNRIPNQHQLKQIQVFFFSYGNKFEIGDFQYSMTAFLLILLLCWAQPVGFLSLYLSHHGYSIAIVASHSYKIQVLTNISAFLTQSLVLGVGLERVRKDPLLCFLSRYILLQKEDLTNLPLNMGWTYWEDVPPGLLRNEGFLLCGHILIWSSQPWLRYQGWIHCKVTP